MDNANKSISSALKYKNNVFIAHDHHFTHIFICIFNSLKLFTHGF